MRGKVPLGLTVLLAASLTSCISDRPSLTDVTGATSVRISNFAFAPVDITVPLGAVLTWTNDDAAPHTVTADNGAFDSIVLNQNGVFQYTASTAGTFTYYCRVHPYMKAKLTVTP